ncbi:MAG: hypothetical protein R6X09_10230 [Bacteroidales bacterium]
MKKLVLLLAVCLLFGLKGYSQFAFGVAPGLSTNSAYFGFKAGKVVPYIGFQYAGLAIKLEESGEAWDDDEYDIIPYSNDIKIKGNLYVPNLGVKVFAVEQNKLKAYFNLSVAKPFLSAKYEEDGEEFEELSDLVKEIKLIGGEFGFGVEYFFDNNFSIGGEFGLRYLHAKYTNSYEDEEYNYDTGTYEDVTIENTLKASMSPTYSKISLNFYFGGKGE